MKISLLLFLYIFFCVGLVQAQKTDDINEQNTTASPELKKPELVVSDPLSPVKAEATEAKITITLVETSTIKGETNEQYSIRDIAAILLVLVSIGGLSFNFFVYGVSQKDKLLAAKKDNVTVIFKEIVLPNYIEPMVKTVTELSTQHHIDSETGVYINTYNMWKEKKGPLRYLALSGASIELYKPTFRAVLISMQSVEDGLTIKAFPNNGDIQFDTAEVGMSVTSPKVASSKDPFLEIQNTLIEHLLSIDSEIQLF